MGCQICQEAPHAPSLPKRNSKPLSETEINDVRNKWVDDSTVGTEVKKPRQSRSKVQKQLSAEEVEIKIGKIEVSVDSDDRYKRKVIAQKQQVFESSSDSSCTSPTKLKKQTHYQLLKRHYIIKQLQQDILNIPEEEQVIDPFMLRELQKELSIAEQQIAQDLDTVSEDSIDLDQIGEVVDNSRVPIRLKQTQVTFQTLLWQQSIIEGSQQDKTYLDGLEQILLSPPHQKIDDDNPQTGFGLYDYLTQQGKTSDQLKQLITAVLVRRRTSSNTIIDLTSPQILQNQQPNLTMSKRRSRSFNLIQNN